MQKHFQGILMGAAVAVGLSGFAGIASSAEMTYKAGDRSNGYTYATKETQGIQDDDIANPAYVYVDDGEALWSKVDGKAGKSCASCHAVDSAIFGLTIIALIWPSERRPATPLSSGADLTVEGLFGNRHFMAGKTIALFATDRQLPALCRIPRFPG